MFVWMEKSLTSTNKLEQDLVEWQCLLTETKAVDNVHHFWTDSSTLPPLSIWNYHGQAVHEGHIWQGELAGCGSTYASENSFVHGRAVFWRVSQCRHIEHQLSVQVHAFLPGFLSHRYVNHSSPGTQ